MPTRPYGAVIVDYDLDGDNDVIIGCSDPNFNDPDSIVIMFNDGWGNFEIHGFEANSGIFIYCEDLTNDGYPDIISRDADSIFFYENDQQGGLGNLFNICHTIGNRRIGGIADMDTNGYLDIVYYGTQQIRGWGIAYNLNGFDFNDDYIYYSGDNEYITVGLLNDDSIADVLVTERSSPEGAYIMYNSIDTFQKEMLSTRHWAFTYIFDVDGDQVNESVLEYHSSDHSVDSRLLFFKKDENEKFELIDSTSITGGSRISSIDDFDNDGFMDIAFAVSSWQSDPSEDSVFIFRNNQNWKFYKYESHYIGGWFYPSIISGDLNMDGYKDAVTIGYLNPTADYIQLLWNDGTGHFLDTNNVYVGYNETGLNEDVILFPNPSNGVVQIKSPVYKIKEITITDYKGSILIDKFCNTNSTQLDLNFAKLNSQLCFCIIKFENNDIQYHKLLILK